METNILYGNLDIKGGQFKTACLEDFASLPAAPTSGRFGMYNSKLSFWDGAAWQMLPTPSAGSTQLPANTVFVSPNFTNVYPYYSTLAAARAGSAAGDKIIVYTGTYAESANLNDRNWYFYPMTIITGYSVISSSTNTSSIKGYGVFTKLDIYNSDGNIFEFEYAGNLSIQNSLCYLKATTIGSLTIMDCTEELCINAICIQSNISISMSDYIVYLNFVELGGQILINQAKAIMQFEHSTMTNGLQALIYSESTSQRAYLKIIDAKFNENYANSAGAIKISGHSDLELQHVSLYNHGASSLYYDIIYIDGTALNFHKIKLDNCLLFGYPVNAKIANQNVYNINSVAVTAPRGNVNVLWETLKYYTDLW